jgi:N-terminal domain of anti-restriction factor ArdC
MKNSVKKLAIDKAMIQQQALENALNGQSVANYQQIFEEFEKRGIPINQILPRENVFTFNAWKAKGRVVKKGEHGVSILTFIHCTKKDKETGEETPVTKAKKTNVFHISQTKLLEEHTQTINH